MNERGNFNSQREEHQTIIEDQSHCCLCGTELEFRHVVDYETMKVLEQTKCPSCMIKTKPKDFTLQ